MDVQGNRRRIQEQHLKTRSLKPNKGTQKLLAHYREALAR